MVNEISPFYKELINDDNIVVNEVYVKGYYSSYLKIYAIVWDGVFSDEEYTAFFHSVLDFASENTVNGVISDVRMQGKVSTAAKEYLQKNITPIGDQLIKRVAVVVDGSPFKMFYLNAITKLAGKRAKIFSDPSEAFTYLLKEID